MLEFYIKNCSLCTVCLVLLRLKLNHFNRSCFLLFRLKMNHFNRICFLLLHLIAISLDLCFCLLLCLVNVSLKRKLIFFKYLNCLGPRVVIILFEIRTFVYTLQYWSVTWKFFFTVQLLFWNLTKKTSAIKSTMCHIKFASRNTKWSKN